MMKDKIIVALDTQDQDHLDFLLKELRGSASFVKVGMELFYTLGADIIKRLKNDGFKVFLDLKLHDIPRTVHQAAKTLGKLDVDILNVHAAGGIEMMKQGLLGYRESNEDGMLIAVTQLTSTDQRVLNQEILIPNDMNDAILKYAFLTKEAKLAGVVCSAHEAQMIKEQNGNTFKCITPGIRPAGVESHDQKRIMTPLNALANGSDYLVIGRAINLAQSPKKAYLDILQEIS